MKTTRNAPLHLAYLDGVRGLIALYVLLHHYSIILSYRVEALRSPVWAVIDWALSYGRLTVGIFIVLSGYVLMLPVVRSDDGQLRDGLLSFFKRRAWRILPAYYTALFLFSGLIFLSRRLHLPNDFNADLTGETFFTHLFLVHNWNWNAITAIDPAMWSLALEWQIYFVFVALLLPLYRRIGIVWTVVLSFAATVAVGLAFVQAAIGAIWYVGLFALGMLAAHWQFRSESSAWVKRAPWGRICSGLFLLALLTYPFVPRLTSHDQSVVATLWTAATDALIGFATLALIMHSSRAALIEASGQGKRDAVLRVLESKPLLALGLFSYSLYLLHHPLIDYSVQAVRHLHLPPWGTYVVTGLLLPVIIAFCYGMYLLFEKPFIKSKPAKIT